MLERVGIARILAGPGPARTPPAPHDTDRAGEPRTLDEAVGAGRQTDGAEQRAGVIEPSRHRGVTGLGNVAQGHGDDHRGERKVDEEDPPPGRGIDQPPADERPDGAGDASEAGPGADGARPVLGTERRLQDGETAGGEKGGADALEHPSRHQGAGGRGQPAEQ